MGQFIRNVRNLQFSGAVNCLFFFFLMLSRDAEHLALFTQSFPHLFHTQGTLRKVNAHLWPVSSKTSSRTAHWPMSRSFFTYFSSPLPTFQALKNEGVFMELLYLLTRERPFPFSTKTCHVEHVHSDSTHSKSLSMKFNHYENMDSYYSYYFLLYIKPYVAG